MTTPNKNPFEVDWSNVNLEEPANKNLNLIDGLTFGDLLLEISCNIGDINEDTVAIQFKHDMINRMAEGYEIFRDNLKGIVAAAKKERNGK